MHITILGAGAIGTAIKLNIRPENTAELWDKDPDKVLNQKNLDDTVPQADIIFFCFPTPGISEGVEAVRPLLKANALVVTLAKGLSSNGQLATEIIEQGVGPERTVLLTGPMLAQEFAEHRGAAGLVASKNSTALAALKQAFTENTIHLEYSSDVRSAALVSVWKNIYTLIIGIAEGAGYGNNIQGHLAALSIQEASLIAEKLFIDKNILQGLAGTADFLATAFSPLSRNRQTGVKIGRGLVPKTTEGIRSLEPFIHLLKSIDELPILQTIYKITTGHENPRQMIEGLLI